MGVTSLLQADLRDAGQPASPKANPGDSAPPRQKSSKKNTGPTPCPLPPKRSGIALFFGQYKDLLTLILLAATAVSLLLGEWMDAVTIGIIVLCNGIMGFVQEFRTEKTLEALQAPLCSHRPGAPGREPVTIPAQEVTVGDILLLEAGCRVAADGVVLESIGLSAEESLLTGEAEAVSKQAVHSPYPDNEAPPTRTGVHGKHHCRRAGQSLGHPHRFPHSDGSHCRYAETSPVSPHSHAAAAFQIGTLDCFGLRGNLCRCESHWADPGRGSLIHAAHRIESGGGGGAGRTARHCHHLHGHCRQADGEAERLSAKAPLGGDLGNRNTRSRVAPSPKTKWPSPISTTSPRSTLWKVP